MRVLIATQYLEIIGGVETYLRALIPLLSANGFDLAVLSETGGSIHGFLAASPDLVTITTVGKSVAEVMTEVEKWQPDVVYNQGLQDTGLEDAVAARFPTVLFAHNYAGTCVSGTKCHSLPQYETCQRTLGLGCLAAYLPRGCGGRNPLTMLRLYSKERKRLRTLSRYRTVLVASNYMADEFRRHGIENTKLKLVPLFPTDELPDSAPPAQRPRSDRVLFVGRITRLKGLLHLITALPLAVKELGRKLVLVVAGDGPARTEAETTARDCGVPAEFLGWITPERRKVLMRSADILAVPSVWPEPFGLVGVEAGCVGLPAVGYASGGIPDWLIPGVSGESASGDHPNPAELALAIVRALKDDRHWQKLRVGAWENVKRFTAEEHLRKISGILQTMSLSESIPPTLEEERDV